MIFSKRRSLTEQVLERVGMPTTPGSWQWVVAFNVISQLDSMGLLKEQQDELSQQVEEDVQA